MPSADQPERGDLVSRPIILIGCGRSGSTLFTRVLNAHPDVQFLGETDFLVARVWREVWENRFWLHAEHNIRGDLASAHGPRVEIPAPALHAAKERAARSVRMLFAEILELDPASAAWGYKEVWNGNDAVAQVPWSIYHTLFPGARWVHLVRNPFSFAKSSARWNQLSLTADLLAEELRHWRQVVEWSQQLKDREGFFAIRYEDLVTSPEACLTPILASAGVSWHEDCTRELSRRTMVSKGWPSLTAARTTQQAQIEQMIDNTKGLAPLMKEFGYSVPHELEIQESIQGRGTALAGKKLRKAVKRYLKSRRPHKGRDRAR